MKPAHTTADLKRRIALLESELEHCAADYEDTGKLELEEGKHLCAAPLFVRAAEIRAIIAGELTP